MLIEVNYSNTGINSVARPNYRNKHTYQSGGSDQFTQFLYETELNYKESEMKQCE